MDLCVSNFWCILGADRPKPQPKRLLDVAAGKTAFINVTVVANPLPRTTWMVGSERFAEGDQRGRFEAHAPQSIGNGAYNVTLSIVELQPEDATIEYALNAENLFGKAEYLVQLSAMPAAASAADGDAAGSNGGGGVFDAPGGVVLVSLAAVVLLLSVAILGVARVTGRCCFGRGRRDETEEITQEKV